MNEQTALNADVDEQLDDGLSRARKRLDRAAAPYDIKAPQQLLDDSGAPSRAVMDFCKQTGVSLDHIFCDAPNPTLQAETRKQSIERSLSLLTPDNLKKVANFVDELADRNARASATLEPDPIVEALDKYRKAADAFIATKDSDPELEKLFFDAEQRLIETPVRTPKGAALKLQYALSISGLLHCDDESGDRRMFEQIIDCLFQS